MTEKNSAYQFRTGRIVRLWLLFFTLLSYPFLSLLWRHGYPVFSAEAMLFLFFLISVSLVVATLAAASRTRVANAIIALSLTLILILQFNLLFEQAAILLLVTGLLALFSGEKFGQLSIAVTLALIIGAYADARFDKARSRSPETLPEQQPGLPIVVHIMLDGFIGMDGLPPQDQPQAFRSSALEFLEGNGFEVFTKAYSRYHTTQDSLLHAFSFTNDGDSLALQAEVLHEKLKVGKNRYFDLLVENGYSLNIYQSELVEFCAAVPKSSGRCMTYRAPSLNSLRLNASSAWVRLKVLANHLFSQSYIIHSFLEKRGWIQNWGVVYYDPGIIDEIGDDLERFRSGAYFAHLLLPHAPFVFQNDCSVNYDSNVWPGESTPGLSANTVHSRAGRYLRYLPQAACALAELRRLFNRMRELGLYDEAIIVVHGDHGSRISLHSAHLQNRDVLSPEDFRDIYSVLFAIKLPGKEFENPSATMALDVLLKKTAREIIGEGQGLSEQEEESPFIYLYGQLPLYRVNVDIFEEQ